MTRTTLLVTSALVALSASGTAFAQSVDKPAGGADQPAQARAQSGATDDSTEVGSVIVQVNKRNENVEDVPVAVTAYTPEQRDILGVVSIFDFTRATPSFEYSTALDRSFIRGVGRNTNAPGTQAGIALYVDGVYTSSTYGLDRAPILSGNFEADAGPQGTLFGRNSIGGVLQQNSVHATDHFQIQTDSRYNDHQRFDEAITIGGPINDHIKLLVGADWRTQKKGYFNNIFLHQDTAGPTSERLYLGIADYNFGKIDGFVKVELNGFNRKLSQYSQYGSNYINLPLYNNDLSSTTNFLWPNPYFNCATADPTTGRAATSCPSTANQALTYYDPTNPTALNNYNIKVDLRTSAKSHDNWTGVDQTTWHLPWFDLKYIGGYTQYIYDNHQDGDGTARGAYQVDPDGPSGALPAATIQPMVINYFENRKWSSHEFDFSSNSKGALSWIVGLYYYQDDFLNTYHQYAPGQLELSTTPGVNNPHQDYVSLNYDALTKSEAVFGQFDYKFTPKWTLTAGLRWNRDDVTTNEFDHYYSFVPSTLNYNSTLGRYVASDSTASIKGSCTPAGVPTIASTGATCSYDPATNTRIISDSWDGWGGVVNLSYKPDDASLAYLKYSRGYKAGGIVSSSMAVQPILNPENLNSYEAGYKFSPNRSITINTDVYYYDYRNYQDFGSIANSASSTGFSTIGFNIPKSRNIGAELTALWHPTHAFTLTMTGNYMDAKVTDGTGVCLVDNLDPAATGNVSFTDAATGKSYSFKYTPQICGSAVAGRQPQKTTGDALKGASPWKVWITPDYRLDFEKGSLDLLATYSWRAGNVSAYSKNPIYEAPAYSEVDLRFVWRGAGSKYQIIGFVNNVSNKQGTEFVLPLINTSGQKYIQNVLTIPRTWGVELQTKF